MAQHDYVIANQGFPAFRSDLNDALAAIVSNNSGVTEPTTMFAHQIWVDTAATDHVLKIRNADNDAWITIGSLNQTNDTFKLTPAGGISTDTIAELTSATGVTVDGVLLKDGLVNTLTVGRGANAVADNTAVGASALAGSVTGTRSTAIGFEALKVMTSGDPNTAVGAFALKTTSTGAANAGVGAYALEDNTTGSTNSALGNEALLNNTTGGSNTAIGASALQANTTASNNTAVGYRAGYSVVSGTGNVFVGKDAGYSITLDDNTHVGIDAGGGLTTVAGSVCIGRAAGFGLAVTNTLYIARDNVAAGNAGCWIFGASTGACTQGNNSSSWTTVSDERLKNVLGDSSKGLAEIMQVEVKKFKYKPVEELPDFVFNENGVAVVSPDPTNVYTGAIAQQVQTPFPESINVDEHGVLTVDSDPIFWAMLKAIQELKAEFDAYKATHP